MIEYHHRTSFRNSFLSHFLKPFEDFGFGYNIKAHIDELGGFQNIIFYIFKENNSFKQ